MIGIPSATPKGKCVPQKKMCKRTPDAMCTMMKRSGRCSNKGNRKDQRVKVKKEKKKMYKHFTCKHDVDIERVKRKIYRITMCSHRCFLCIV